MEKQKRDRVSGIVQGDYMDETFVDRVQEGLIGLRELLAGKHLRPAQLALTIAIVAIHPERAEEILMETGKQARWENVNGT